MRAHKLLKHTIMKKAKRIIAVLAAAIVTATAGAQTKNNGVMENVLDRRQQHIVAIANLEARGEQGLLGEAISAALDDSVTVNDIKEALSQLYAYTGFPRSLNALGTLQRVVAERAQAGKASVEGRDADPLPEGYDALKQGTEVQTKLTGKPYDYKFAPATDYYLKAHLFGDIFARNNLTFAERELVTVSALSGIEGAEPQLRSHINGARNMGLSDAEIHSIPLTLPHAGPRPRPTGPRRPLPMCTARLARASSRCHSPRAARTRLTPSTSSARAILRRLPTARAVCR